MEDAALRCFADQGYAGTSMAGIAQAAGAAPANVHRYFPFQEALFAAVVPADLPARLDELLETRVAALAQGSADRSTTAKELLDNARRALAHILRTASDREHARTLVTDLWS